MPSSSADKEKVQEEAQQQTCWRQVLNKPISYKTVFETNIFKQSIKLHVLIIFCYIYARTLFVFVNILFCLKKRVLYIALIVNHFVAEKHPSVKGLCRTVKENRDM